MTRSLFALMLAGATLAPIAPAPAPAKVDSNEASWRLVKGSLPIYLPSWSMPLYMAHQNAADEAAKSKSKSKKKK